MAATRRQRVKNEKVMSFDDEKSKRKPHKRKQPFVKISYNSGSDADAESDDNDPEMFVKMTRTSEDEINPTDKTQDGSIEKAEAGAGWADAMAKILGNEASEEGAVVLGKSKEYAKKKEKEEQQYLELKKERESHKQWEKLYRVKPKVTDREHERSLQRTSTRGVVQLFNAVKKQQKFLEDKLKEAGSETKRLQAEASISKGDFLDLLKGPKKTKDRRQTKKWEKRKVAKTEGEADKPMWSVLREDFMMGAKMKDWDKSQENAKVDTKNKDTSR